MNLLRKFCALFRRRKLDADMAEEMRLHLERRMEENIASGMSAEDARHAARRIFGSVDQAKEIAREQRGLVWLEQTFQDVRYAVRQLARAKGFTFVVVATLALGIGATTAIYSVVDAVLLHPVPGPDSDRLVQIDQMLPWPNHSERQPAFVTAPVLDAVSAVSDWFESLTWCETLQLDVKGTEFSTSALGTAVPVNFFSVMGTRPRLGRTFSADEVVALESGVPARDTVIIISYGWWQSHFDGDPQVLGRTVELSGRHFTIVGVMPAHFQFPSQGSLFWLPVRPVQPKGLSAPNLRLIARLNPGTTQAEMSAVLDLVKQRLLRDYPANDRSYGEWWRGTNSLELGFRPLREALQGRTFSNGFAALRRTLLAFVIAVGFVLAIVCANVANLMLVRAERRRHEFSVRAALGAGRLRLIRQSLVENLLLAFLGGGAGLVVAAGGIKLLVAFNTLPRLRPIEVDGGVLALAFGISSLTGLVVGLAPAWHIGARWVGETLRPGCLGATAPVAQTRLRAILVVAEIAVATVLLIGAGLSIRSVVQLLRVEPGFDSANLISVQLDLTGRPMLSRETLLRDAQERLSAIPGVTAVGIWKDGTGEERIEIEGRTDPLMAVRAFSGIAAADFFQAARIPLLHGRYFESSDAAANPRNVVVNETFARRCWPGENPVGRTFRTPERTGTYEVVGVVGDARLYLLHVEAGALFYLPIDRRTPAGIAGRETLVVRTTPEPASMISTLRHELKRVNADMRMPGFYILGRKLYDATQPQRTFRNYLAVFAGIGLSLAALGIYGVLSYTVAQRTKEIGIRLAIGADRRHVIRMILKEGTRLIALGLAAGLIAAYWLTQLLQKQLYGIGPRDPAVVGIVIGVLGIVALLACWLPARRAAKVDPIVALRAE